MTRKPQMTPDQMRQLARQTERDNPGVTAQATPNGRHVIAIRRPPQDWIAAAKARAEAAQEAARLASAGSHKHAAEAVRRAVAAKAATRAPR